MTTTDPFTTAARVEAIWKARDYAKAAPETAQAKDGYRRGFRDAAEWARDHLAAQEPTDAEIDSPPLERIREFLTHGAQIIPREDVGWVRRRGYRDACRDALNCLDGTPDREWPDEDLRAAREAGGKS